MSGRGGPRDVQGWGRFGHFGAQGTKSWELLAAELADRQGAGLFPAKTWRTQLKYLDGGPAGLAALAQHGLTPTRRQRAAWALGGRPNKANQNRIRAAYEQLRTERVAKRLTKQLEAGGGTRVEITPITQQNVDHGRRRPLAPREFNIRHWAAIVRAWSDGDDTELEALWTSELEALGSDWSSYEYASAVGILD